MEINLKPVKLFNNEIVSGEAIFNNTSNNGVINCKYNKLDFLLSTFLSKSKNFGFLTSPFLGIKNFPSWYKPKIKGAINIVKINNNQKYSNM